MSGEKVGGDSDTALTNTHKPSRLLWAHSKKCFLTDIIQAQGNVIHAAAEPHANNVRALLSHDTHPSWISTLYFLAVPENQGVLCLYRSLYPKFLARDGPKNIIQTFSSVSRNQARQVHQ